MGEKHVTKRQLQSEASKKMLMETAIRLFNEHGFDKVTVNDICREAGASVGMFYHHFKSKQEVLIQSAAEDDEKFARQMAEKSLATTYTEALLEFFCLYASITQQQPFELVQIIVNPAFSGVRKTEPVEDSLLMNTLLKLVRGGQETGEIKTDYPAEEIAKYLQIAHRGYVICWCEDGGKEDIIEGIRKYMTCIISAFAV